MVQDHDVQIPQKKWLNILLPLAGQQNDDDVGNGTAVFHEKKIRENDCLFFCFVFSMFFRRSIFYFENQFRNIGI